MREIRPSGSEGGVALTPPSLPLSIASVARAIGSARYYAGGDGAVRHPYHPAKHVQWHCP